VLVTKRRHRELNRVRQERHKRLKASLVRTLNPRKSENLAHPHHLQRDKSVLDLLRQVRPNLNLAPVVVKVVALLAVIPVVLVPVVLVMSAPAVALRVLVAQVERKRTAIKLRKTKTKTTKTIQMPNALVPDLEVDEGLAGLVGL